MSQSYLNRFWQGLAIFAAIVACARIGATWGVFTETYDEAIQLACGMEWLDAGRYTFEEQHPPLARVAIALGPWLADGRSHGKDDSIKEGQAILYTHGDSGYFRMLSLARAGNLLFVLLACLGVWLLARCYVGPEQAAWAVVAFTLLPPILGHGGLATTDMALTATVLLAAAAWRNAVLFPSAKTAAVAGVVTGVAIVSKFSAVVFLPIILVALAVGWRAKWTKRHARLALVTAACCFFTMWTAYRFDAAPLHPKGTPELVMANRLVGERGALHDVAYSILDAPLPLYKVVRGFAGLYVHAGQGHDAYLFGEFRRFGWWYFYPVVLAVKTPLVFLLLVLCGAAWLAWERRWRDLTPVLAAALLLILCLPSRIDTGVRYLLPVYGLTAVIAGYAVAKLRQRSTVGAALVLLGWAVAGAAAHPDYLADFNMLAGSRPEEVLTDSDLDWGQDLHRATAALQAHGATEASLAYHGVFDFARERRVRYRPLPPSQPAKGWIAISLRTLYGERARKAAGLTAQDYEWLRAYPYQRVGRSMMLFYAGD